jgi:hypothetical protein
MNGIVFYKIFLKLFYGDLDMTKKFILFLIIFFAFFNILNSQSKKEVSLDQNYPNPFNSNTTISFNIRSSCNVNLEIFNLIGQRISTLISGELPAGNYIKQWNPGNQPSGIYFYKLKAGSLIEVKRLVLIK